MKNIKAKLGITVISFLTSIIIVFILDKYYPEKISFSDQIIISSIIFLVFMHFEFLYFYKISTKKKSKKIKLLDLKHEGDKEISNIRSDFHQVINEAKNNTQDIFVIHFLKEFKKLEKKISEVVEKKELYVNAEYFLNADNVLKAFPDFDSSTWCYTWNIENPDLEFFKQEAWCQFFEKTAKLVTENRMRGIKAILILHDKEAIKHPRIEKLLSFYKANDNNECKIIFLSRYLNILKSNNFTTTDNFGIYGKNLLYIEKEVDDDVAGSFIKNKDTIEEYLNLFNQLWDSDSITLLNPSTEKNKITVNELIEFDKSFKVSNETN